MGGNYKNMPAIKTRHILIWLFLILIISFQTDLFGMDLTDEHKCHKRYDSSCQERVYEQFSGPPFHNLLGDTYYLFTLFNEIGRYSVVSNSLTQQNLLYTFGRMDLINDSIFFIPEISVNSHDKSDKILNIRHIENIEAAQKYEQELKMKGVRVDDNRIVLFIDMRQKVSPAEWEEAESLARNGDQTVIDFFNQICGFTEKMTIFRLSSIYSPL